MYHRGEYVTVLPVDADPWILHMQRHVIIENQWDGGYRVRLGSAAGDFDVHGPIPEDRLRPGWVEQDGRIRADVHGRRP